MSKKTLRDIILVAVIVVTAASALAVINSSRRPGTEFEILVGGELFGTYRLDRDAVITVGDLCVAEVKGGEVFMRSSTCANQTCVHHRPISSAGDPIVCLPNSVTVRIKGGSETDYVV